jgi:methylated-DNA-[protein]-cysteine S-methyltransferase
MLFNTFYNSPIGLLNIIGSESCISSIQFIDNKIVKELESSEIPEVLKDCKTQLDEYFNGKRKEFNVKIQQEGSDFQQKVWKELMNIPFGQTVSYLEVAKKVGDEKSVRAVGNANGKNQIPIIIPCHRVIGSNGSLTGYAGKIWRKKWLLQHEMNIENPTFVLKSPG